MSKWKRDESRLKQSLCVPDTHRPNGLLLVEPLTSIAVTCSKSRLNILKKNTKMLTNLSIHFRRQRRITSIDLRKERENERSLFSTVVETELAITLVGVIDISPVVRPASLYKETHTHVTLYCWWWVWSVGVANNTLTSASHRWVSLCQLLQLTSSLCIVNYQVLLPVENKRNE